MKTRKRRMGSGLVDKGQAVHCTFCAWEGSRVDCADPCPSCDGQVALGTQFRRKAARMERRSCGVVGVRDPQEEAATIDRLRQAREDAAR